jgi:hypothetical protein
MGTAMLTWAVLLLGAAADDATAPWASNHHPTDVAQRHVREITLGRVEYEWESSIYVFEGRVTGDRNSAGTALNMTPRPGEALVWRWGHLKPIKYHGPRPPRSPERLCNGLWEYRPDFKQPSWRAGATTAESIRERDDGLMAKEGKTGIIV